MFFAAFKRGGRCRELSLRKRGKSSGLSRSHNVAGSSQLSPRSRNRRRVSDITAAVLQGMSSNNAGCGTRIVQIS